MKPINFVKTLSTHERRALRRWVLFSLSSILITVSTLTAFWVQAWFLADAVAQEQQEIMAQLQSYDQTLTQKNTMITKQEGLQKKLLKITTHLNEPKNPGNLLKAIKCSLSDSQSLESFSVHNKILEVKIAAHTSQSLMKTADTLAKHQAYSGLHITSLEHKEKNHIVALLTTNDTKKKSHF